jgi:uncharacterized protein (DUF305 family)
MNKQGFLVAICVIAGSAAVSAQSASYMTEAMDMQKQMMTNMTMKPSGNPDKDFVMMMIPHHQGAINMAQLELKYGKDPELKALAESIIRAQDKEISQMKTWQKKMN